MDPRNKSEDDSGVVVALCWVCGAPADHAEPITCIMAGAALDTNLRFIVLRDQPKFGVKHPTPGLALTPTYRP